MAENKHIPTVLVVDDEPNIRELVQVALTFHGCTVVTAASGQAALREAAASEPDLVVLDVVLPDLDGFEVCRRLRARGDEVPIIFLTARDTSSDTVQGLALGGDDYVTKPFSVEALVARIRAVLRRAARAGETGTDEAATLQAGDLELDESRWTVQRAGTPVELSPTEFRLLAYLMRHQGRVLSRAQLLENVWGWDYAGQSQIVETYVSYLQAEARPARAAADPHATGRGLHVAATAARPGSCRAVPAMKRSARLSLRARLLAGLIAVTALFLVIMGTVSAFVIGGHLEAQFDDSLLATLGETPAQLQASPAYALAFVGPLGRVVAVRQRLAEHQRARAGLNAMTAGPAPGQRPGPHGLPGPGRQRPVRGRPAGHGQRPDRLPRRRRAARPGRRRGAHPGRGRADHRLRAAGAAGGGRPMADRPGSGPAQPDGDHGPAHHHAGRPDRADARSRRPRRGRRAGRRDQHHAGPDPAGVQRPAGGRSRRSVSSRPTPHTSCARR